MARLQGRGFAARLVRSARRQTLAIHVRAGEVTVRAPAALDEVHIQQFLLAKTDWITRHLQRQQALPAPLDLADGASVPFLGEPQSLVVVPQPCASERLNGQLRLSVPGLSPASSPAIKAALAAWYSGEALTYLPRRVAEFAPLLKVQPQGLKVRFYKSRWGSCNRRGELQFNWLIMVAPPPVIDYVVVHELCHLRHFNHSRAFWDLLASILPDYQRQRQWLKQQACLTW